MSSEFLPGVPRAGNEDISGAEEQELWRRICPIVGSARKRMDAANGEQEAAAEAREYSRPVATKHTAIHNPRKVAHLETGTRRNAE